MHVSSSIISDTISIISDSKSYVFRHILYNIHQLQIPKFLVFHHFLHTPYLTKIPKVHKIFWNVLQIKSTYRRNGIITLE